MIECIGDRLARSSIVHTTDQKPDIAVLVLDHFRIEAGDLGTNFDTPSRSQAQCERLGLVGADLRLAEVLAVDVLGLDDIRVDERRFHVHSMGFTQEPGQADDVRGEP